MAADDHVPLPTVSTKFNAQVSKRGSRRTGNIIVVVIKRTQGASKPSTSKTIRQISPRLRASYTFLYRQNNSMNRLKASRMLCRSSCLESGRGALVVLLTDDAVLRPAKRTSMMRPSDALIQRLGLQRVRARSARWTTRDAPAPSSARAWASMCSELEARFGPTRHKTYMSSCTTLPGKPA